MGGDDEAHTVRHGRRDVLVGDDEKRVLGDCAGQPYVGVSGRISVLCTPGIERHFSANIPPLLPLFPSSVFLTY